MDSRQRGKWVVGVDVGGTTVATVLANHELQHVHELTASTDVSSPDNTLDGIAGAIRRTLEEAGVSGDEVAAIGLGVPGQVDSVAGISRIAVNLNWYDFPVTLRLQTIFGAPCYLENDVRVAALGVYRFDNPDSIQNLIYFSIGTGLAAGIILEGELLRGRHGMAGEFGHFIVDPAGPPCNCGAHGCLETLVSATAVARMGRETVAAGQRTTLAQLARITAKDVYDAAAAGDSVAMAIVEQVGTELGRALRSTVLAYDTDAVVLGGGVTRAGDRYLQPILAEWKRQRATSALARALLRPEILRIADPTRNMGAWGSVALAAHAMGMFA